VTTFFHVIKGAAAPAPLLRALTALASSRDAHHR
jgi:hypothetical protein